MTGALNAEETIPRGMTLSQFGVLEALHHKGPLAHWTGIPADEASGGTPYSASTFVGDGSRLPCERELAAAKAQGKWVAEITKKLRG